MDLKLVVSELFKKVQKNFQGPTSADVLKICKLTEQKPINENELLVFAVYDEKVKALRMTAMGFYRKESDTWVNDYTRKEEQLTHWMLASDLADLSK